MPTLAELGQKVKTKYPGQYDDLSDDDVARKVQAKFPGQYDDFTGSPVSAPAPKPKQGGFVDSLVAGLKTFRPALSQPDVQQPRDKNFIGPPRDIEAESLKQIKSDPAGYIKGHIPMLGTVDRAFSQPLPDAAGTIIGESAAGMLGGAPGLPSPKIAAAARGAVSGAMKPVPLPHKWAAAVPPVPAVIAGGILGHFAGREFGMPEVGAAVGAAGPIVKGAIESAAGKPWLPEVVKGPPRPSGSRFEPSVSEIPDMQPVKATQTPSGRKPGGIHNQVDTPSGGTASVAETQQQHAALLDDIARGMGAKSYAKLSPEGQATVRGLAEKVLGHPIKAATPQAVPLRPAPPTPKPAVPQQPLPPAPRDIGALQQPAQAVPPQMRERGPVVQGTRPSELGQHDSVNIHEVNAINKINNVVDFLKKSDFLDRNKITDLDQVTEANLRQMYDEAFEHGKRAGNPVPKTKYATASPERDTWLKIKREMNPEKYDPAGLKDFLK